jgi:hypothetical protein
MPMADVSFRFAKRYRFGKRYKQSNGGRCGDVSWSPKKSEGERMPFGVAESLLVQGAPSLLYLSLWRPCTPPNGNAVGFASVTSETP